MVGVEVRYSGLADEVELRDADGELRSVKRGGTVRVHRDVANSLTKRDDFARVRPAGKDDPDGDDPEDKTIDGAPEGGGEDAGATE